MLNIDMKSIHNAIDDFQQVFVDTKDQSEKDFNFTTFKSKNHDFKVAAVDGSNHNVKGNNLIFTMFRVGHLIYQSGQCIEASIDPIKADFLMNNQSETSGYQQKFERYFHDVIGELPKGKMEFEKVSERIRSLLEWEKIKNLISMLDKDDVIIFDGSLMSGAISTNNDFYNELVTEAKRKGISLVGLSKDTSLSIDSAPIPIVLLEASKKQFSDKNWYVDIDDFYFVKFIKNKDLIFRVDAVVADHISFGELMSRVGAYCFDQATLGYPYPMQKIHDSVRISEMERDYCFEVFKNECLKQGISHAQFDKMFSIYHDQLDKISFGR